MLDLTRISTSQLETAPYRWAAINQLFSSQDAAELAATFPQDHFKRLSTYDGEKNHEYEIRCVTQKGEASVFRANRLSAAWRALAKDITSPAYREAMSSLTGLDLADAPLALNAYRYPPRGLLGAHADHRDKIVTHILYFNQSWNDDDGGCLTILRSSDAADIAATVSPVIGNSTVLVRSDDSWHAVSRVADHCQLSRLSLTATFYRPGSTSAPWPSWHGRLLLEYPARVWNRLKQGLRQ